MWVRTPHNVENNEKVREELTRVVDSFGISDYSFAIVREVFPSDGILHYAKETGADMIGMATHARRGIAHFFSGSLTEDTINHVDIPVWTFKLDKKGERLKLSSVEEAKGVPEYRKIVL